MNEHLYHSIIINMNAKSNTKNIKLNFPSAENTRTHSQPAKLLSPVENYIIFVILKTKKSKVPFVTCCHVGTEQYLSSLKQRGCSPAPRMLFSPAPLHTPLYTHCNLPVYKVNSKTYPKTVPGLVRNWSKIERL